jgi:cob(I)alamin adenosyltransferase
MRISTGGGDRGRTSLFSGERVTKSHVRVEAYGDVDELNSWLGTVCSVLSPDCPDLAGEIHDIQACLLSVGSWLSTTPGSPAEIHLKAFTGERVKQLEALIQNMEGLLPTLKNFLIPGGHLSSAFIHVCRCVCRRAERRVIALSETFDPAARSDSIEHIIVFLNRLSDYLFLLGRICNQRFGISEVIWKSDYQMSS